MALAASTTAVFVNGHQNHSSPEMNGRLLSATFRSVKRPNPISPKSSLPSSSSSSISEGVPSRSWCVYLILSTKTPIKTYVGVTNDFSRRLRQHNGEFKGGAKASRAGRPWVCACLIQSFRDQSEACEFESKWKSISKKLPRKRKNDEMGEQRQNNTVRLLQHRQAALNRVKSLIDCSHLEFDWQLNSF